MTFFAILDPDQSYPFQNDLKNIPNKVTSNMEAPLKQELQKLAYPSFSLQYLPVKAVLIRKMTQYSRAHISLWLYIFHLFTTQNFHSFRCFELEKFCAH